MSLHPESSRYAPRYPIPSNSVVTIEHPFVVKNVDKAMDMLGGQSQIAELLSSNKSLPLSFNPSSPVSRTIMSAKTSADNVLLRFTVPKRIGKRKRGSDEPFTPVQPSVPVSIDTAYLLRSIRDNKQKTRIEAVGNIQTSDVWRSLPDFDYSTRGSQFLTDIQSKILPQQYTSLQEWKLPRTFGLQNTDVPPPSTFTTLNLPQAFNLHPSDQDIIDARAAELEGASLGADASKNVVIRCDNLEPYPSSLPADYPKLQHQVAATRRTFPQVEALFKERPIWTRRGLKNHIRGDFTTDAVRSIGYVAFSIITGPWGNTYCAYGVDPRSDPQFRKYQTIRTALRKLQPDETTPAIPETSSQTAEKPKRVDKRRSHIFTGQGPLTGDGQIFQLCDLEDPQLKSLVEVDRAQLSPECDLKELGWYGNGTLAKIRLILRTKTTALRAGKPVPDSLFERIIQLPNHLPLSNDQTGKGSGMEAGFLPESASSHEKALAAAYRRGCQDGSRQPLDNGIPDEEDPA